MPVTNDTRKKQYIVTQAGPGTKRDYEITFPFLKPEHIKAVISIGGIESQLVNGVDFTVTLPNTFLFTSDPPLGAGVTIYRYTARTRETDYEENGRLSAQALDDDFDRATMINIEQQEDINRTTQSSITEASGYQIPGREAMKGNYLAFDPDTGDPIPAPGPMGGGPWSQYANYVIGDIINVGEVQYIALTNNRNKAPASNPTDWKEYHDPAHDTNLNLLNAKGWNDKEKVINGDFAKGSYGWTLGTGAKVRQQGWVAKFGSLDTFMLTPYSTFSAAPGQTANIIGAINWGNLVATSAQIFIRWADSANSNLGSAIAQWTSADSGWVVKNATSTAPANTAYANINIQINGYVSGDCYVGFAYGTVNGTPITTNWDFADGATGWSSVTADAITYDPANAYMGNALPGGSGNTLVLDDQGVTVYSEQTARINVTAGEQYILSVTTKKITGTPVDFYLRWRDAGGVGFAADLLTATGTGNWENLSLTATVPTNAVKAEIGIKMEATDGLWLIGSVSVKKLITASEVDPKQIATVWENWRTYEANTPVFFEGEPYEPNPADMPSAGQSPADTPAKWLKTGGGGGSVGNIAPDPTGAKGGAGWTGSVSTVANGLTGFATELQITADSIQTIPIPTQLRGEALELRFEAFLNAGTNVTVKMYSDVGATVEIPMTQTGLNPTGKTAFVGQFWAPGATVYMKVAGTGEDLRMTNFYIGRPETVQGAVVSEWQSYDPFDGTYGTSTQGWGTATNKNFRWRRNGSSVDVKGTFTSGVHTAVELRIALPKGLTSSSGISTIESCGFVNFAASAASTVWALIEPSVSYFTFGDQGAGSSSLTKDIGTAFTNSILYSLTASIPCAQFTSSMTIVGMNEPFFLSNSENTPNQNGVAAKTQIGTWAPILANTATTYYDLQLHRPMMLGEKAKIILRSKVDGSSVPVEIAGVPSLFCKIMHSYHDVSIGESNGMWIEKVTSNQIRVRQSARCMGFANFNAGSTATQRPWSTIIAAADGYDAWMVEISRGGEAWAVPPVVYAEATHAAFINGRIPIGNVIEDTVGGWTTGANARYTFKHSGLYSIGHARPNPATNNKTSLYKNGTLLREIAIPYATGGIVSVETKIRVVAGDYIEFYSNAATTDSIAAIYQITRIGS